MKQRQKFIQVRVSESERATFMDAFKRHGLNLSAEVRAFLERKTKLLEAEDVPK